MAAVAALHRYPVKGLTPEPLEALVVQADGRVAGDRTLAFRFADATRPEVVDGLDHWPKTRGLALLDFPSLARLKLAYDHENRRLRITDGDRVVADAGLGAGERRRIADAVTDWVLAGPEGRLLRRPGRLPLELVGDGVAARFQDRPRGFVSLHGRASVEAVARAVPSAPVDDRRFRSNVVIDGVPAWGELVWAAEGAHLAIGEVGSRSPAGSHGAWRSPPTPTPGSATHRCSGCSPGSWARSVRRSASCCCRQVGEARSGWATRSWSAEVPGTGSDRRI
jgi:uncharacterized protein YcbX